MLHLEAGQAQRFVSVPCRCRFLDRFFQRRRDPVFLGQKVSPGSVANVYVNTNERPILVRVKPWTMDNGAVA